MNRQRIAVAVTTVFLLLASACGGEVPYIPKSEPQAKAEPATNIRPQSQALMLEITSPELNLMTDSDSISVAGITSPDATLSINGRLVLPSPDGKFATEIEFSGGQNPQVIDVIASSITGELETRVLPVVSLNQASVSRRYGNTGMSALFGTVTSATESEIELQTNSGPVTLSADDKTTVNIHGWNSPTVSNLAPGTSLAILTDGQHAVSALAILARPAQTKHFTWIVTALDSDQPTGRPSVTLMDETGRQVTATMSEVSADRFPTTLLGELVTVVLKQDLSTGTLYITGADQALAGADRINKALALNQSVNAPEAPDNISALRWRLAEHGVRNISMLVNSQPYDGSQKAVDAADEVYTRIFSEHQIGAPAAEVTGLVTAIATSMGTGATKLVTVLPKTGQAVKVKISEATSVALSGERIKSGQLDLASRIKVRYGLSGHNASRVTVMAGNTLSDESSNRLAGRAGKGEIQGTLTEVGALAAVITILDHETKEQISLQSSGALFYANNVQAKLDPSAEGSDVTARFDPSSFRLLELESVTLPGGQETVTGVVHSLIPKIADGNLTIRTPDGQLRSFSHNSDTSIRRDGLNVSILDVRIGDLVRPNTRVTETNRPSGQHQEIVMLGLKEPEPGLVTGIIRGVTTDLNGQIRITVSNIWLDLICLKVNSQTTVTRQGQVLGVADLKAGQEVALGSYDPVTFEVGIIALDPPNDSERASLTGGSS